MEYFFSVVIATKNRKDDLDLVIPAFLKQTYPKKEIIVVDNASTDGTKDLILEKYPEVRYYYLPDNINILAQNYGVYLAKGNIIWRTDSDSNPIDENLFYSVNEYFNKFSKVDILTFSCILPGGDEWSWYQLNKDKYFISEREGYNSDTFCGPGAAIKKTVFEEIGGFWEFGMEEKDFTARALLTNKIVRYRPDFKVIHYASSSERNNQERWINLARQYLRYMWKFRSFSEASLFTLLYIPIQLLQGIYWRVGFLCWFEGLFAFKTTIFRTIRKNRLKLSKTERKKLDFGRSEIRRLFDDYKFNIKRKFGGKK
ncbi:MAG: hypothetical protein Kapaf2KO_14130 [Candidatus Kapaibacteriales bacterium]